VPQWRLKQPSWTSVELKTVSAWLVAAHYRKKRNAWRMKGNGRQGGPPKPSLTSGELETVRKWLVNRAKQKEAKHAANETKNGDWINTSANGTTTTTKGGDAPPSEERSGIANRSSSLSWRFERAFMPSLGLSNKATADANLERGKISGLVNNDEPNDGNVTYVVRARLQPKSSEEDQKLQEEFGNMEDLEEREARYYPEKREILYLGVGLVNSRKINCTVTTSTASFDSFCYSDFLSNNLSLSQIAEEIFDDLFCNPFRTPWSEGKGIVISGDSCYGNPVKINIHRPSYLRQNYGLNSNLAVTFNRDDFRACYGTGGGMKTLGIPKR
jgi:hypothetical protein